MDALEHDKELAVMKMRLAAVKKERDHDVAASQEGIATLQQRITALDTLHKSELEGQIAHTRNALICTHHAEKNALIAEFHKEKNALICTHHDKKTALIAEFNKEIELIHQHNNEKNTRNTLICTHHDEKKALIAELNVEKNALVRTHHDEKTALIAEFNKEKIGLIHQHNNEKNALIRSSDDEIKRVELALEKDKTVLVGEYKELKVQMFYLKDELKRYKAVLQTQDK